MSIKTTLCLCFTLFLASQASAINLNKSALEHERLYYEKLAKGDSGAFPDSAEIKFEKRVAPKFISVIDDLIKFDADKTVLAKRSPDFIIAHLNSVIPQIEATLKEIDKEAKSLAIKTQLEQIHVESMGHTLSDDIHTVMEKVSQLPKDKFIAAVSKLNEGALGNTTLKRLVQGRLVDEMKNDTEEHGHITAYVKLKNSLGDSAASRVLDEAVVSELESQYQEADAQIQEVADPKNKADPIEHRQALREMVKLQDTLEQYKSHGLNENAAAHLTSNIQDTLKTGIRDEIVTLKKSVGDLLRKYPSYRTTFDFMLDGLSPEKDNDILKHSKKILSTLDQIQSYSISISRGERPDLKTWQDDTLSELGLKRTPAGSVERAPKRTESLRPQNDNHLGITREQTPRSIDDEPRTLPDREPV